LFWPGLAWLGAMVSRLGVLPSCTVCSELTLIYVKETKKR
jgi:hypothetical protein